MAELLSAVNDLAPVYKAALACWFLPNFGHKVLALLRDWNDYRDGDEGER